MEWDRCWETHSIDMDAVLAMICGSLLIDALFDPTFETEPLCAVLIEVAVLLLTFRLDL